MTIGAGRQRATVILPTFRRPDALRRALAALAQQVDPGVEWELVVIDNDDAPGCAPIFERVAEDLPVPARYVREPNRGSAHARNRGIAEATGSIIAMIDDDVVPEPGWLHHLLAPIVAGRCEGTGGQVDLDPTVPRPRWFAPWMAGYLAEFQPADEECDLRKLPDRGNPNRYVLTASAAFLADALRATGGFDPTLGPRSGNPIVNDDVYICRRFMEQGGRIHYVPKARVVHELPPARLRRRYLLRRVYAQGRSDWLLDRHLHRRRRFGGVKGAVSGLVALWRDMLTGRHRPEQALLQALAEASRVAGFVREGLADKAPKGSRRPPT